MIRQFFSFDSDKLKEYCLIVGYFASLFSSTCFFFNAKQVELFGSIVQLPIGLTFFPLTFALCNIVQDKYGRRAANSLVIMAFIFDTLLVFGGIFLAWLGDRADYWSVFKDMHTIMVSTWFFLIVSSVFNVALYNYFKTKETKNIFSMVLQFFITITATELLISLMSMPLMFYKKGLSGSILLTVVIIVLYKILANIVITAAYAFYQNYSYGK